MKQIEGQTSERNNEKSKDRKEHSAPTGKRPGLFRTSAGSSKLHPQPLPQGWELPNPLSLRPSAPVQLRSDPLETEIGHTHSQNLRSKSCGNLSVLLKIMWTCTGFQLTPAKSGVAEAGNAKICNKRQTSWNTMIREPKGSKLDLGNPAKNQRPLLGP